MKTWQRFLVTLVVCTGLYGVLTVLVANVSGYAKWLIVCAAGASVGAVLIVVDRFLPRR